MAPEKATNEANISIFDIGFRINSLYIIMKFPLRLAKISAWDIIVILAPQTKRVTQSKLAIEAISKYNQNLLDQMFTANFNSILGLYKE